MTKKSVCLKVSKLFVLNFLIFLIMYTGSLSLPSRSSNAPSTSSHWKDHRSDRHAAGLIKFCPQALPKHDVSHHRWQRWHVTAADKWHPPPGDETYSCWGGIMGVRSTTCSNSFAGVCTKLNSFSFAGVPRNIVPSALLVSQEIYFLQLCWRHKKHNFFKYIPHKKLKVIPSHQWYCRCRLLRGATYLSVKLLQTLWKSEMSHCHFGELTA